MKYKAVLTFRAGKNKERIVRQFSKPFDSPFDAFPQAYKFTNRPDMINVAIVSEDNELIFLIESKDYIPHIYNLPEIEVQA